MRNRVHLRAALLSAVSALALAAAPVMAQEGVDETDETTAAVPLKPLIVTASPIASPIDELAAPVDIVTRDEILSSSATTLGGLLGDLPGVSQSSFAAGASRPIIRGLDNTRVRMQENGIGAADVKSRGMRFLVT